MATPIKRSATVVRAEYEYMLRQATGNGWEPRCSDKPEEYSDYDRAKSQAEAAALCEGCPMLALCRENALIVKPGWTVLGGISWKNGRQVTAADME